MKIFIINITLLIPVLCSSQTEKEISHTFVNYIFVENNYKAAQALFEESLQAQVSDIVLQTTAKALHTQLGEYKNIIETNQEQVNSNAIIYAYTKFNQASMDIKLVFDANKKLVGFFIVPHKIFKTIDCENILTIPNNNYPIKGELTIPKLDNKKILAIFIHGSGPQDKDATIYQNKPFKDIAEGLSLQGITSYRFDKKSLSYPSYFNDDKYTIDEEVCNDIYTIVNYFKQDSIYPNYKIILIGHSMGGMLLPKIANNLKNNINGIVMIAANSLPFQNIIDYQLKYLYSIDSAVELKNQITELQPKLKYLKSKNFILSSSKTLLPLNLPAPYWKSIINYNQLAEAKKIIIPTFIIQGQRDYQVSTENYKLWKKTLKNKSNFSFKLYPKLNHILLEGVDKSTPSEYQIQAKVPEYFIKDIAEWIVKI